MKQSRFTEYDGDRPKTATGEFTLRGLTRPLELEIDNFKCINHPMEKREACGAKVCGSFNRGDYGLNFTLDMGFKTEVELEIQVEALRQQ